MNWYRADLHIHSVLSPCGDLDMSPVRIIQEAKAKKLDIIGITDHNSTLHAESMLKLGQQAGIVVFPGAEVTTREEVHCLTFFENIEKTKEFQQFIDSHTVAIKNKPERFGYQLLVNSKEEILDTVESLLIVGLDATINEIEQEVHRLDGVFIPAHVNRASTSIFSQMGFIPEDLDIDAIEYSAAVTENELLEKRKELAAYSLISNSDAHYPNQLGQRVTSYFMNEPSFSEWKKALKGIDGRKIKV